MRPGSLLGSLRTLVLSFFGPLVSGAVLRDPTAISLFVQKLELQNADANSLPFSIIRGSGEIPPTDQTLDERRCDRRFGLVGASTGDWSRRKTELWVSFRRFRFFPYDDRSTKCFESYLSVSNLWKAIAVPNAISSKENRSVN
jgi:hypothetical protein